MPVITNVLIVAVMALTPVPISGAQRENSPETSDPANLVLRLDSHKNTFVLYEPVVLSYSLVNPTDSTIHSRFGGFLGPSPDLYIQHENGELIRFHSGPTSCIPGIPETSHHPHQVMTGDAFMFFNDLSRDLAFPRTGTYRIIGKIYVGNSPDPIYATADPVEIEIVEPASQDKQLIDSLGSTENLVENFQQGTDKYCREKSTGPCLQELRLLVDKFPGSAYAPYLAFYLAESYNWEGAGAHTQYPLAAELFLKVIRQWPSHPLAVAATTSLIYALDKSGRKGDAIQWIDQFERKHPDRRDAVRQLRQLVQGIEEVPDTRFDSVPNK